MDGLLSRLGSLTTPVACRRRVESQHAHLFRLLQNHTQQRNGVTGRRSREQRRVEHDAFDLGEERPEFASELLLRPLETIPLRAMALGDETLDGRTVDDERRAVGAALIENREHLTDVAEVRRDVILEL